jgi:hypothetical protein
MSSAIARWVCCCRPILQAQYWDWRDAYPGPHWVHFQTTDVHPPYHPPAPFAGRVVPAERGEELAQQRLNMNWPFGHDSASVHEHWQEELAARSLDPGEL